MPLEGYIEWCTAEYVSGWVWDSDHPAVRLAVDIYQDDTLLCRLNTETYRKDLADAGIGDGAYGFAFTIPAPAARPDARIAVVVAGSDYKLPMSEIADVDFTALAELDDPYRHETLTEIVRKCRGMKPANYLPVYEQLLGPLRFMPLTLLELGINTGGSLQSWATYFPYGRVAGVDLQLPAVAPHERIAMFAGDQADTALLARIAAEVAPAGFDIVIDDCAHLAAPAKTSFWYLFENHLKPGGLYIIEDWATGYWPWWPDGRAYVAQPDSRQRMPSHDAGMVGFIKQLVDELHAMPQTATRQSKFADMTLHAGLCIIRKAVPRP